MMASSGSGSIPSVGPATTYFVNTERDMRPHIAPSPSFDSVSISPLPTGDNRSFKEVVSRLSQEVRTATTTGDIQALRQQVASGQYRPDPMAIAARILFLGEAE